MGETKGKDFEELVACINSLLHKRYIVTANDKIRDKDTGCLRQIDISIRTSDGPTNFLGIIEARCRNRPVNTEYVEQISEKARSVRANAAYIVSTAGFSKTAIKKAKQLNIGVLSYSEAFKTDWIGALHSLQTYFGKRRYDKVFLFNMDPSFSKIFNPHPDVRKAVIDDIDALVLVDKRRKPIYSIARLAHDLITKTKTELYEGIISNKPPVQKAKHFKLVTKPQLFLFGEDERFHKFEYVLLVAHFFIEEEQLENKIFTYSDPKRETVFAEVASSEFTYNGFDFRQEVIATHLPENEQIPVVVRLYKI